MKRLFLLLAVMTALAIGAQAQTTLENITVLNEDNHPLANALVQLPGGYSGTTDGNGYLQIKLPAPLGPTSQIKVTWEDEPIIPIPYFEPENAGIQYGTLVCDTD